VDDVEVALAATDPPVVGTTEPHPATIPTMESRQRSVSRRVEW
jgi:hypothetical protein